MARKVTTGLLYAMMLTHIIWYRIPLSVSNAMIAVCTAMMLSFVLYIIRNAKAMKAGAGFTHGNDVPLELNERNKSGEIRHDLADTI